MLVPTRRAGPTVLEMFNTLLRQLRLSIDYALTGSYDGAASLGPKIIKEQEERMFQEAVIKTIGGGPGRGVGQGWHPRPQGLPSRALQDSPLFLLLTTRREVEAVRVHAAQGLSQSGLSGFLLPDFRPQLRGQTLPAPSSPWACLPLPGVRDGRGGE